MGCLCSYEKRIKFKNFAFLDQTAEDISGKYPQIPEEISMKILILKIFFIILNEKTLFKDIKEYIKHKWYLLWKSTHQRNWQNIDQG